MATSESARMAEVVRGRCCLCGELLTDGPWRKVAAPDGSYSVQVHEGCQIGFGADRPLSALPAADRELLARMYDGLLAAALRRSAAT